MRLAEPQLFWMVWRREKSFATTRPTSLHLCRSTGCYLYAASKLIHSEVKLLVSKCNGNVVFDNANSAKPVHFCMLRNV